MKKKSDDKRLLTREEFCAATFAAAGGKCCVPGCGRPAADAHHVMDRKLWSDGGYYAENGAALCSEHHLDAESGKISPADCLRWMERTPANLRRPDKLDWLTDEEFLKTLELGIVDKWGN